MRHLHFSETGAILSTQFALGGAADEARVTQLFSGAVVSRKRFVF
jgi:hypothetical protein